MSELFKLKNGTVLVSTEAPGGIYNSAQLRKIADLCSKELAIVKATEDQRLALFVKETDLQRIIDELQGIGLGFRHYQAGLHQPVSCLGELCESHDQPALTTAMELTKLVADMNLQSSLKIGINGCARCCTPCHTLDVSIVGEASGYRLSLGGKTSQFPELASFFAEHIPAKDLPRLIANIIVLYQGKAEAGETLHEVLDRCGVEEFVAALAPYSQDAAHRDDPFATSEESTEDGNPGEEPESEPANDTVTPDSGEELDDGLLIASDEGFDEPFADDLSITSMEPESISADPEMISDDEVDSDLSFDLSDEISLDSTHLEEVPIGRSQSHALSEDISLQEMHSDSLHADDDLSFDRFDEEEAADAVSLPSDEMEITSETLSVSEEVAMVTAVLRAEEAAELAELEVDTLDEENLDGAIDPDDAILTSEEIIDAESEILSPDGDLEADVLQLTDEETSEIPELDEDLLKNNAIDTSILTPEDEEEGDMMSSEDELMFEAKIQASIEEEKKMRDEVEEDTNQSAREDALRMMENAGSEPEPAVKRFASESFEFDGFDIEENVMRVHFSSGAYLDLSLDSLPMSRSRVFKIGSKPLTVTNEENGYTLEVDGMKMFYPHQHFRAA